MLERLEDTHKIIISKDQKNRYLEIENSTKKLIYKSKLL